MGKISVTACSSNLSLQLFTQLDGFVDHGDKALRIKINIGQCGEDCLHGKAVHGIIHNPFLTRLIGKQGHAAESIDEHIFKIGNFFVFTADTNFCAGNTFGSLFTLITIHSGAPLFNFCCAFESFSY